MQTLVGGDSWNTSRWQRKGLVTSHWGQFRAFLMRLEAGCRSTARTPLKPALLKALRVFYFPKLAMLMALLSISNFLFCRKSVIGV